MYLYPSMVKIISDMLASDIFTVDEKKLAATGIRFLFNKRINHNYK